ncbi:MAG: hypothetical protein ACFNVQ_05360 [Campylobacter sp.]
MLQKNSKRRDRISNAAAKFQALRFKFKGEGLRAETEFGKILDFRYNRDF